MRYYLKDKSEMSLRAAEFLHSERYYSSVVHCAYYSCFQLMEYIRLHSISQSQAVLGLPNKQENNRKDKKSGGSHEILINQISLFLSSQSIDDEKFAKEISELKRLRIKADYHDILIDPKTSSQSIHLAVSIQQILKPYL